MDTMLNVPRHTRRAVGSWGLGPESAARTREELHRWVVRFLGVRVPDVPMVEGHQAPFDYLAHVYFDGRQEETQRRRDGGGSETAKQRGRETGPIDCVVWANRGGGKTFLGAVATALDLLHKPGIEVRILAGSLEQAGKMYAHLRRVFERPGLAPCVKGRITSRRITLTNGSTAELLAQSDFSVRGTRVQRLRCDEVELFEPSIWEAAQLTTRSKTDGGRVIPGTIECLSTMHVPFGLMATLVREAQEGRRALFKWSLLDVLEECVGRACHADGRDGGKARAGPRTVDAGLRTQASGQSGQREWSCSRTRPLDHSATRPLPQLPGPCPLLAECDGLAKSNHNFAGRRRVAGFVSIADAIRMKGRVSAATWESEMLCLRANRSETVYPEFDPAVHVLDAEPGATPGPPGPSTTILCGIDFGYRAPTVILWATLDDGVLCVFGEHVHAELILQTHVRAIVEAPWGRPAWVGIDPAGNARNEQTGVSAADVLRKAGLRVRSRSMTIHRGVDLVRARLKPADGPARISIHPRCTHLIEALEKYHYNAKDPTSLDPVKDGPDHAADALRYLITNLDAPATTRTWNYLW